MTLRLMLGGLKSLLPALHSSYRGTSGPATGAYCYSVWMRHQAIIARAVPKHRPTTVVELGPGESLGVGYAALLSGADRYIGLDLVDRLDPARDLAVLDEIVTLFERRSPIPNEKQFPNLQPRLKSYAFPKKRYADDGPRTIRLDHDRVESIRAALLDLAPVLYDDRPLGYLARWDDRSVDRASVDLVLTQASLQDLAHGERRSKLAETFAAMGKWLKPGGVMSHQINFAFPGGETWNHHWRYSDAAWLMVRGNRPLFENREPLSTYLALCEENGCRVVSVKRVTRAGLAQEKMAPRFRALSEDDRTTESAHVVAVKG
ncbi:MAG TPA: hypothetical protein VGP25_12775 [Gemmatimonadaceae bacterium]|nr:hypothetical protein [Gemmatimonadaceae bacterium]